MRIYLIPFPIIDEDGEKEIMKKIFGLKLIDAFNFWYLHGVLEDKFNFDTALMYVDLETYESDIVEMKDGKSYLVQGIYDVEVEGYDKLCKAFMWQSEDDEGITLLRGLVVDPTVKEDLEYAQKQYEKKPFIL